MTKQYPRYKDKVVRALAISPEIFEWIQKKAKEENRSFMRQTEFLMLKSMKEDARAEVKQ